jgi:hypothetical protein
MTRSIPCPYCPRLFANTTDLHQHIKSKRRISEAHGLRDDGTPRTRAEIKATAHSALPAVQQETQP